MRLRLGRTLGIGLLVLGGSGCPDDGIGQDSDTDMPATTTGMSTTTPPPTATTATAPTGEDTETTMGDTDNTSTTTTGGDLTLLERVVEAIGGEANLTGMTGFELAVSGSKNSPDEGPTPGGPPADASDFTNTVTYEVETSSLLVDVSRTVTFEGLGAPHTFQEIVQDNLGHVDGIESLFGFPTGDLPSDRWAAITREQKLLNPHLLLLEVLADVDSATEAGMEDYDGRAHELLEIAHPVFPITLWVDSETDLISRLTTMENHYLRRDVEIEVIYTDWDSGTDVLFPAQAEIVFDGETVHDETRDTITVNPDIPAGAFDFPDGADPMFTQADADRGERNHQWHRGFAGVGIAQTGVQDFVMAQELSAGVHWLTGGSHHSMVIEQEDGVVVLEAPLYEARCVAILDWIDANLDSAPVTHVVTSHFHQDHTGCARTFVARGATLVIGEGSASMWDTVLAAPSTIEPDELEASPVKDPPVMVVPNGGSTTLDDATHPIVLYDLQTDHADDMLLPFVESTGDAFVVDLFSPGFPPIVAAGAQEVLDAMSFHGIDGDVNQIVGGHGGLGTMADLQAAAGG